MTDDRPNLVLVTIDSLRADHCGFEGYDRDTTPTLDEMAAEGLAFESAISPGPATPESMPATFTGEYPVERGEGPATGSDLEARRERIRAHMAARDTLPERLGRLGYETAAFTPNPFTSRHFGFDDGFDRFEDFMDESSRGRLYRTVFDGFLEGSTVSSLARVLLNVWQREEVFKPWESYYDDAIAWTRDAEEPYFLWVFLMDAHNPYLSSRACRTQSRLAALHANVEFWRQSHETPFSTGVHEKLVTAYDDSIRYADAFLEGLRSDLAGDDPVIAVHGDHGEAFGEHGSYGHEPYLYPENVHVPFVVSGAVGSDAAGSGAVESGTVERPISLRALPDVLATIATGGDPTEHARDWAVARTRQGDRRALHVPDGCRIAGADGSVATGTLAETDATATTAVLDHADVAQAERATAARAAAEVAGGDTL